MNTIEAWSYSRYRAYKDCPAAFKYAHVDKRPAGPGSPAMQRGEQIHLLAEKYAKKLMPKTVPAPLARFEKQFLEVRALNPIVENGWGFRRDWSFIDRPDWFGPDVWFRMKADLMINYRDDTADLIDHKTGKMYGTNEEQVELFALSGFKRFPHIKHITTRLWYLDSGEEIISEYSARQVPAIQKKWEQKIKPMFADRRFAPLPSWRCGTCAFSKAHGGPCKF